MQKPSVAVSICYFPRTSARGTSGWGRVPRTPGRSGAPAAASTVSEAGRRAQLRPGTARLAQPRRCPRVDTFVSTERCFHIRRARSSQPTPGAPGAPSPSCVPERVCWGGGGW